MDYGWSKYLCSISVNSTTPLPYCKCKFDNRFELIWRSLHKNTIVSVITAGWNARPDRRDQIWSAWPPKQLWAWNRRAQERWTGQSRYMDRAEWSQLHPEFHRELHGNRREPPEQNTYCHNHLCESLRKRTLIVNKKQILIVTQNGFLKKDFA